MTTGEKQRLFHRLYCTKLVPYALSMGYEMTGGEWKRSDEQAEINALGKQGREALAQLIEAQFPSLAEKIRNNTGSGIRNSLHEYSLAVDTNLFKNDVYLTRTEDWRQIGEYWEQLHPDCRWGGRFGDGNHLSIEHWGKK